MNKKILLIILLVLVCAWVFIPMFMKPKENTTEEVATTKKVEYGKVVVAVQDIGARTEISPEMVQLVEKPSEYIHPMAATNLEDVYGQLSLLPMNAGEEILSTKTANPDTDFLSYRLREGYVAYTVAVSELNSAGGMIRVGDRLNIMGDFTADVAGEDITDFFLYDIPVIAIGKDMAVNSQADAESFSSMTLEVTPEQSQKLAWAQNHGTITYILTSVYEENKAMFETVNATSLFSEQEKFNDLKYINELQQTTQIREAELALEEFGMGDVQQIRDKLEYENLYYDDKSVDKDSKDSKDSSK